jgi:hypothetical protein
MWIGEQAGFMFNAPRCSTPIKCVFKAAAFVAVMAVMSALAFTGCQDANDPTNNVYVGNSNRPKENQHEEVPLKDKDMTNYVPAPYYDGVPVTSFLAPQYSGTVVWVETDSKAALEGNFKADTEYTATVSLKQASGYNFNGVTADFFEHKGSLQNGLSPAMFNTGTPAGGTHGSNTPAGDTSNGADKQDPPVKSNPHYDADTKVLTIVFPRTGNQKAKPVEQEDLTKHITVPVAGESPAMFLSAEQYRGTIEWSPANNIFNGNMLYTATITLTAASGYTFTGVKADFFTHYDATSITNMADSGVVTVAFPETRILPTVTDRELSAHIPAPERGRTPVKAFSTPQYTGKAIWNPIPQPGSGFIAGTEYTATVTLTATRGWTFEGVPKSGFGVNRAFTHDSGATVTHEAGDGGSLTITINFPKTISGLLYTWFSGNTGYRDSAIDLIRERAKVNKSAPLVLIPSGLSGMEEVEFSTSADLGVDGLVLDTNNSPARVTIDGGGRVIDLIGKANGHPLITVKSGVTLVLRNITLDGIENNTAPLVRVETGGTLIMEAGAVIQNNVNKNVNAAADQHGGGVIVAGGTLTMNGGQIRNNATSSYLKTSVTTGTFTMKGGRLYGNKVDGASSSGGGVGVGNGNPILNGGTVSDTAEWRYGGGGVHVLNNGVFTMNDGEISGNEIKIFPKFVASAGEEGSNFDPQKGSIAYSLDGETWTTINLPGTWWGLAYANDRFIALSSPTDPKDGQIAYSMDGVNWTAKRVEGIWWAAAYGNNRYVAVGNGCVAYSTDGETWNKESSNANYRRVVYGNGKFVASTRNQTPGTLSLKDGSNVWQQFGSLSNGTWLGLIYAEGKFITASFGQTKNIAVDKDDGNGWTQFAYDNKLNLGAWGGIAYGDGKFVVVSRRSHSVYSTNGGAIWDNNPSPPSGEWNDVAYGNGRFVAVGHDNKTVCSPDGITWSALQPLTGQWRQVTYGNDK